MGGEIKKETMCVFISAHSLYSCSSRKSLLPLVFMQRESTSMGGPVWDPRKEPGYEALSPSRQPVLPPLRAARAGALHCFGLQL